MSAAVSSLVEPDAGMLPPHSIEAERAVIVAALDRPALLAPVAPEDFYSGAHARIVRAIKDALARGAAVTHATVAAELATRRQRDAADALGDALRLARAASGPRSDAADVALIIELARRRDVILLCRRQLAALACGTTDARAALAELARISSDARLAQSSGLAPTAAEPLRGLDHLARVAILGRERILELAARPVVYLWQDIAIAGIIVLIAGGPGSGKTTLLFLVLVGRLNTGAPVRVLGRVVAPAPPGRFVVLIEAEHSDSSAARKLTRSLDLLGVHEDALERLIVVARRSVRVGSAEWHDVRKLVAAGLVSDIALDTLARTAPADANNEQEQVAIFEEIAAAIESAPSEDTRPVVWAVAHTRKTDSAELADVSGSAQRTGQADTVLLVKEQRRDGRVVSSKVTFAKLREEPDEYPGPVEYTVTRDRVVDVAAPANDERPLEDRILERLALGAQTKTALKGTLGRSDADIETAISALFDSRRITTSTVKVRGIERKAFVLRGGAT